MSKPDPEIALHQILAHAREAVALIQGKLRTDLDLDRVLNLALARLVEIIGEAANRIPEEIQAQYPKLPWLQMIGARNRLIHGGSMLPTGAITLPPTDIAGRHNQLTCGWNVLGPMRDTWAGKPPKQS